MHSIIAIIVTLLHLSSCNNNPQECSCTFEYSPVCADGKQFDNQCLAKCSNVNNFKEGPCNCNINSGQVCATPPMKACPEGMMCTQVMPSPIIYSNECEALRDKAQIENLERCN